MIDIRYEKSVDALAIEFHPAAKSVRMVKVAKGINVDFDADGRLMTIEILDATYHVGKAALEQLAVKATSMTLAEAETRTGLAAQTIKVQIHNGRIKGTKRGRAWFVDAASLEAYLNSRGAGGRPPENARASAQRRRQRKSAVATSGK